MSFWHTFRRPQAAIVWKFFSHWKRLKALKPELVLVADDNLWKCCETEVGRWSLQRGCNCRLVVVGDYPAKLCSREHEAQLWKLFCGKLWNFWHFLAACGNSCQFFLGKFCNFLVNCGNFWQLEWKCWRVKVFDYTKRVKVKLILHRTCHPSRLVGVFLNRYRIFEPCNASLFH